jgi:hypothetical protein
VAIARQWRVEHVSAATVEELHDSQRCETVRYGDLEPRMTVLERASSNLRDPTSQSFRGQSLRLAVFELH